MKIINVVNYLVLKKIWFRLKENGGNIEIHFRNPPPPEGYQILRGTYELEPHQDNPRCFLCPIEGVE